MDTSALAAPYLYNDLMEEDQFARVEVPDENIPVGETGMAGPDAMKQLTQEGVKIQLNDMYKEIVKGFVELKHKLT